MKLVFLGIPGAGKSTQGNLLSQKYNIPYLSTGDIFRAIAKENTPLASFVKETMSQGHLIPDEKTIEIVHTYLTRPEYQKGYILDGFPRTVAQAQKYTDSIDFVLYLTLPDEIAVKRLAGRNDKNRADDTVETIKKRLEVFHKQTQPVIDYYKKKGYLLTIDGNQTIESIHESIVKKISSKKKIITLVGLPGAGKSEAARFFKTKNIPVVAFSNVSEILKRKNLPNTNETHRQIRNQLRKTYGMKAFAFLNQEKIQKSLEKSDLIVIENLRSFEEYEFLQQRFADAVVLIVCIFAAKKTRYRRIQNRKERKHVGGIERDLSELQETNIGPTIAFADFIIENNGSVDSFRNKVSEVFEQIKNYDTV